MVLVIQLIEGLIEGLIENVVGLGFELEKGVTGLLVPVLGV